MSAIILNQTLTAISPNLTSSFGASGGTGPYTYSVRAGGAAGSINASTGVYTAPAVYNSNPQNLYDTVVATDSLGAFTTARILVGNPLILFCDIIQKYMGMPDGRVFIFDQKAFLPTDSNLWISIAVPLVKPFASTLVPDGSGSGLNSVQAVNILAHLDINIMSRGPDARDRKEEVVLALTSIYSEQQQEINSFSIGRLSTNFVNLSSIDGAAIPFRYAISCQIQYCFTKTQPVAYFGTFTDQIYTNP